VPRRLIALVESHDHVCHRYRVHPFAAALAAAGVALEARVLPARPWSRVGAVLSAKRHPAVLLQRKLLPAGTLALLRRSTRRLIFDFDDAVFHRDSYHPAGIVCRDRARRFASTMRVADVVLAGNRHLARCAVEHGAPAGRVALMPTCIDPDRYFMASHDVSASKPDLVWIGSSSTLRGLEQKAALWSDVGRAVPGLRVRLIADRAATLGSLHVLPVPWDERTEAQNLALGGIGISWMPDDEWSRGKCGLKILQYHAAGLPVIANRVGIHTELVQHGRTGFLADTPAEWADAVRALADPDLRAHMGRAGREAVASRFSVAAWSPAFVSQIVNGPLPAAV
jgi:glycosyltransferase involved in cell wall biosynthesis